MLVLLNTWTCMKLPGWTYFSLCSHYLSPLMKKSPPKCRWVSTSLSSLLLTEPDSWIINDGWRIEGDGRDGWKRQEQIGVWVGAWSCQRHHGGTGPLVADGAWRQGDQAGWCEMRRDETREHVGRQEDGGGSGEERKRKSYGRWASLINSWHRFR